MTEARGAARHGLLWLHAHRHRLAAQLSASRLSPLCLAWHMQAKLASHAQAGLTTFDTADIYGPSEGEGGGTLPHAHADAPARTPLAPGPCWAEACTPARCCRLRHAHLHVCAGALKPSQ